MRTDLGRLGKLAVSVVVAVAASTVAGPRPAFADVAFRYGTNFPNGMAAVDYAYSEDGMWRPLTDVDYYWNYYSQWNEPEEHPFNREALRAHANGEHNMTARDANGHLLLDFVHNYNDYEIDATNAGPAFQEHSGRGAGNAQLEPEFSIFWFDDNWLARYMAQAYGRPLPDGLSDYRDSQKIRWQILGGDTTNWPLYNSDEFDNLALDGLRHLSSGQRADAGDKWDQIRVKSGASFDFHSGEYVYPNFTENYHIGLFRVLTEQLLVHGQLGSLKHRDLVQHSVALRTIIMENQQSSGRSAWTTGVKPDQTLMNIETLAVNVLALGAATRSTYGAGLPPLGSAPNGYLYNRGVLSAIEGFSRPGHMTYGPYHSFPAGSYTVEFVMRAFNPTGTMAHLDVYDAQAGRVIAEGDVLAGTFGTSDWVRVSLPVTVGTASNSLEFRTWWHGRGSLDVAEIRVR